MKPYHSCYRSPCMHYPALLVLLWWIVYDSVLSSTSETWVSASSFTTSRNSCFLRSTLTSYLVGSKHVTHLLQWQASAFSALLSCKKDSPTTSKGIRKTRMLKSSANSFDPWHLSRFLKMACSMWLPKVGGFLWELLTICLSEWYRKARRMLMTLGVDPAHWENSRNMPMWN